MFNKDDIMPGYVLEFKDKDGLTHFALVVNCNLVEEEITKCYSSEYRWGRVSDLDNRLCRGDGLKVVKIYGYSKYVCDAYKLMIDGRDLIWERKEAKKMKIEEIEKILGYPIKIVNK